MRGPARPRRVAPVALCDGSPSWPAGATSAPTPDRCAYRRQPGARGRCRPGDLYAGLRARGRTAPGSRARRGGRGAVAVLTDRSRRGARRGRRAADPGRRRPRARARRGRRRRLRRARPTSLTLVGVTGTQGKTTTTQLLGRGLARGRAAYRGDRHDGHLDRRRAGRRRADDARGAGPARAVRGDARARAWTVRDGGLQPRARDGPGRRRGLRRRGLHEPRTRPPRLPRRHRGLLRRQGAALHARRGPSVRW